MTPAYATPAVKGPVSSRMQLIICSTWPNPGRPLVWHRCDGCDAERLWYDCDVLMHDLDRRKWCRNCAPVQVPCETPLYWCSPGWKEGC